MRAFVEIESDAAHKKVEDLKLFSTFIDEVSSHADTAIFIKRERNPDLTHMQSAALSLLDNPQNQVTLFGAHATPIQLITKQQPSLMSDESEGTIEGSGYTNNRLDGDEDAKEVVENCIHSLFSIVSTTPSSTQSECEDVVQRLNGLLQKKSGRNALIHSLNLMRSKKTEIGAGFRNLGDAVRILLDKCLETKDVQTAKMAMMLSQVGR